MPNYGIRVAKSLHNTEDAGKYQLLNSKYPVLKLKTSGQGVLNTVAGHGGAIVEVTHNLGYKPICFVSGNWIANGATTVSTDYSLWNRFIPQGLQVADSYYYYADNTKLYIRVELSYLTDVNNYAFNYTYHIFYDEDILGSPSPSASNSPSASASPSASTSPTPSPSRSLSPSASISRSPSSSTSPSASLSPSPSASPSPQESYGLIVKKTTVNMDVEDITDIKDLVFTSARGVLGLHTLSHVTGTTDASGNIDVTSSHGIGYTPVVIVTFSTYSTSPPASILHSTRAIAPVEWHSVYVQAGETIEVTETVNFKIDATQIRIILHAESFNHDTFVTTNIASRVYNFKVYYYFNELVETF